MFTDDNNYKYRTGGGCGSVGRAVTSDSRGPWFESNHWQKIILKIYCQLYWKDENREKEARNDPFKKQTPDLDLTEGHKKPIRMG